MTWFLVDWYLVHSRQRLCFSFSCFAFAPSATVQYESIDHRKYRRLLRQCIDGIPHEKNDRRCFLLVPFKSDQYVHCNNRKQSYHQCERFVWRQLFQANNTSRKPTVVQCIECHSFPQRMEATSSYGGMCDDLELLCRLVCKCMDYLLLVLSVYILDN